MIAANRTGAYYSQMRRRHLLALIEKPGAGVAAFGGGGGGGRRRSPLRGARRARRPNGGLAGGAGVPRGARPNSRGDRRGRFLPGEFAPPLPDIVRFLVRFLVRSLS